MTRTRTAEAAPFEARAAEALAEALRARGGAGDAERAREIAVVATPA